MKYFNKATRTQLFTADQLFYMKGGVDKSAWLYDPGNPDHVALPDTNPFFRKLPVGYKLVYSASGVPTGYVADRG